MLNHGLESSESNVTTRPHTAHGMQTLLPATSADQLERGLSPKSLARATSR